MAQLLEGLFAPFVAVVEFVTKIIDNIALYFKVVVKLSPFIQGFFVWVPPVFQGLVLVGVTFVLVKIIKDVI